MDATTTPAATPAATPYASVGLRFSSASRVLILSTTAFTLLFAVWLMFGVLGRPIRAELGLSAGQLYWLGAAAVLSGSLLRLPFGILAERHGGRRMMILLLLWTAVPTALVAFAHGFGQLLALSLLFGVAGNSFSIGIAWVSAWSPPERKGLAMGIFGAGNVGASVTKLAGPALLAVLPAAGWLGGAIPGGWRAIPLIYSVLLVVMACGLWLGTPAVDRTPAQGRPLRDMLRPLAQTRVWRFGVYYVVVFGAYVAWSLWLPSYFIEVHGCSLALAGVLTASFIFPASLLRPLGGWLSDRHGARKVTYACFMAMLVLCLPLAFSQTLNLPLWSVALLIVLVGIGMGLGKASVYRYIPEYFPQDVGAVGGLVGTLGALGGVFLLPAFGLVEAAGIRTSAFLLLAMLIGGSLLWLQIVVAGLNEQLRLAELRLREEAQEAAYAAEEAARMLRRRERAASEGRLLDAYGRDLPGTAPDLSSIRNRWLVEFIAADLDDGQPLSLRLADGACLALAGPRAGRFLRVLNGSEPLSHGAVCFAEHEIDDETPERPILGGGPGLFERIEAGLARQPLLLLLDEPALGLDEEAGRELVTRILAGRHGASVILATTRPNLLPEGFHVVPV